MVSIELKYYTIDLLQKDVHTEHCCFIHGCKYGDKDCTVTTKKARQSYLCELCLNDAPSMPK